MNEHVFSRHVNSATFHNRQAPCYSDSHEQNTPTSRLGGIPDQCQFLLLRTSTTDFAGYPSGGRGRFRAYQAWASLLGIHGIRVKPPACVLAGVEARFGPSLTGFIKSRTTCSCNMCRDVSWLYDDSSDSE